LAKVMEK